MRYNIIPAIRLTIITIIFFCVLYPLLILGIAKLAPAKGEGETIAVNGKVVGYKLEGQSFTDDKYFNGRPSAAGYNAAGSSGSNKGPSNPEYLQQVKDRIDSFLVHNPSVKKEQVPADLVTASGSGLDPDISVEAAKIQTSRIAGIRKVDENKITALIDQQKEKMLMGVAGNDKVNVLQLNIELDKLK